MEKLTKQVERVIAEAIKLEINGRSFFNHASEVTHNDLGKKMFLRLAEEEVKHLDTFSRLFTDIIKDRDWKKYVKKEELTGQSPVIEEMKARMQRAEGKSEIEALRIGMELEQNAIDFFEKSAKESDDPVAQEIFRKICDEERFHYDLLQAQYDSVTHSGFWLDSAEFQMDGKY